MSHLNLHLNWPPVSFTAAVWSSLFALGGRAPQKFIQKLRDTGWSLCSKSCVYLPFPYLLPCSISSTHRVQGGLKTLSYLLKIQLQANSPALTCHQRISKPRVRLWASLINMQASGGSWAKYFSEHRVSQFKDPILLMNSTAVMKKEVIIHWKLFRHLRGSAASAIHVPAAFLTPWGQSFFCLLLQHQKPNKHETVTPWKI